MGESSSNKFTSGAAISSKSPVGRKLFTVEKQMIKEKVQENPAKKEEMLTDDFESDGVSSVNLNCNVVSLLTHEYYQKMEVEDCEEADEEEMAKHKLICYYVLNNRAVEEQNKFFERPNQGMRNHLKPLYIKARVKHVAINKVLVDEGTTVNSMPQYMLKRIGMFDTELKPHNMVLSNYEGKIGHTFGVIQVNLAVG